MPPTNPPSDNSRLDGLIASYLEALERGEQPDRQQLLAAQPEDAEALARFFADLDKVEATKLQAQQAPDVTFIPQHEPKPGAIFGGRYKLLENIGEGGMGSVWVAEQQQPVKRRVAIKLVKAGMDSKQVLARFEAERQALAVMDHPNIAKVFDGGMTEQGRPYFVMEYVKGVPLTQYCDNTRLTVEDRLELFIPVCLAVQHAHQKGIIHRDLKPSNILICLYDGLPVPKVIDFGLAKAIHQPLTDQSLYTAHGLILGTPLYMSPEQAELNNLDIDTRTDIYALGVVLYELLTGSTPLERQQFQQAAWQEVVRLIKEVEAPRPSLRLSGSGTLASIAAQRRIEPLRLSRLLQRDLDWIVMKALDKDRNRRYETANGFVADIRRYLCGEAVTAVPPTAIYQLQKFMRKHRLLLATASAFAGLLIIATMVSLGFAFRADRERQAAILAEANEREQRAAAELERNRATTAEAAATANAAAAQSEARRADEKSREVEQRMYLDHMHLVQNFWEDHDVQSVREYLDRHIPADGQKDLRGFEWYYWNHLAHRERVTFPLQPSYVSCVAFAPGGRQLVSGSGDGSITIWNAENGTADAHLPLHEKPILCIACSPDGSRIACGTEDGVTLLIDFARNESRTVLTGHASAVRGVSFSPDSSQLATGSDDQTIKLWDVTSGKEVRTLTGHSGSVQGIAFSPDGESIASGSADTTVKLWDWKTGEAKLTLQNPDQIIAGVAFSSDGVTLAATTGIPMDGRSFGVNYIHLWDVATGMRKRTIEGQRGDIKCLAFTPKGDRLVSGGIDQTVHIWDVASGTALHEFQGHAACVNGVAISPDGDRIASAGGNSWGGDANAIRIWNANAGQEPVIIGSAAFCVAFNPVSPHLAAFDLGAQTISICDSSTGTQMHQLKQVINDTMALKYSRDGHRIYTGNHEGKIQQWNAATGDLISTYKETLSYVRSLDLNADGSRLAAVGFNGSMKVFEPNSGTLVGVLSGGPDSVYWVAFCPDGKLIATSHADGSVWIWDASSLQKVQSIAAHSAEVRCVAFHPDGTQMATASDDHTVKLWNTKTWELEHELRGHREKLMSLAYSPDGSRLASAGWDGVIHLWSLSNGQSILTLDHGMVTSLAFNPEGTHLASAGYDGTVRIWNAPHDQGKQEN